MLRDEKLPGPGRISFLAEQFAADHHIPVMFIEDGEEQPLAAETGLALHRVAQEALTNVAKHAEAERVEVRLTYRPDHVVLRIEDFGRARVATPAWSTPGHGLTGMRERAELLGGELLAVHHPEGFAVDLRVPR